MGAVNDFLWTEEATGGGVLNQPAIPILAQGDLEAAVSACEHVRGRTGNGTSDSVVNRFEADRGRRRTPARGDHYIHVPKALPGNRTRRFLTDSQARLSTRRHAHPNRGYMTGSLDSCRDNVAQQKARQQFEQMSKIVPPCNARSDGNKGCCRRQHSLVKIGNRQPREERRTPPIPVPHQPHRRGNKQRADNCGVKENGQRDAESERLDQNHVC
jgi:hypothetical protein